MTTAVCGEECNLNERGEFLEKGFVCKNSRCVTQLSRCDGWSDDCGDNSDEEDCP